MPNQQRGKTGGRAEIRSLLAACQAGERVVDRISQLSTHLVSQTFRLRKTFCETLLGRFWAKGQTFRTQYCGVGQADNGKDVAQVVSAVLKRAHWTF